MNAYTLSWYVLTPGHTCDAECQDKDLLECYEERSYDFVRKTDHEAVKVALRELKGMGLGTDAATLYGRDDDYPFTDDWKVHFPGDPDAQLD